MDCKCGSEMFEVSRIGNRMTMKCDDCGKQGSVFSKREIEKTIKSSYVEVPMWKL
jgi:hypothetical protein